MADENDPTLPDDNDLSRPIQPDGSKPEKVEDGIASHADPGIGRPDPLLRDTRSLDQIEQDIARNFFKPPKKSLESTAAGLIGSRYTNVLNAYKRFSNVNGGTKTRSPLLGGPATVASRVDRIREGIAMAGAQASVGAYRFQNTYQLPYMKKSLALAYERTRLARTQLQLTDKMRSQLLVKLDAIKLNTAAPESAKGSLWEKIWAETRRQAIGRVASSIQDIGFQYANRVYTRGITAPVTRLRDRMSSGETLSQIIGHTATHFEDRMNALRNMSEKNLADNGPNSKPTIRKAANIAGERLGSAGSSLSKYFHPNSKVLDVTGKAALPIIDLVSRYNPFNKNIFTPLTGAASAGGDDFVSIGGSTVSGASPLFKAFTAWVREYRQDQHELKMILTGHKVSVRPFDKSDPEKEALSAARKSLKETTNGPKGKGILSGARSFLASLATHDPKRANAKKSNTGDAQDSRTQSLMSLASSALAGLSAVAGAAGTATTVAGLYQQFRKGHPATAAQAESEAPNVDPRRAKRTARKAAEAARRARQKPPATPAGTASHIADALRAHADTISGLGMAGLSAAGAAMAGMRGGAKTDKPKSDTHADTKAAKPEATVSEARARIEAGLARARARSEARRQRQEANRARRTSSAAEPSASSGSASQQARAASSWMRTAWGYASNPLGALAGTHALGAMGLGGTVLGKWYQKHAASRVADAAGTTLGDTAAAARQHVDNLRSTLQAHGIDTDALAPHLDTLHGFLARHGRKGWDFFRNTPMAGHLEDAIEANPYMQEFLHGAGKRTRGRWGRRLDSILHRKTRSSLDALAGLNYGQIAKGIGSVATGTAGITAATMAGRWAYNRLRGRPNVDANGVPYSKSSWSQRVAGAVMGKAPSSTSGLQSLLGFRGLSRKKLADVLKTSDFKDLVDGTALKRLDLGEPIQNIFTPETIDAIRLRIAKKRMSFEDTLGNHTSNMIRGASRFAAGQFGAGAGEAVQQFGDQARAALGSQFGSIADNLKSVTDAVGAGSHESIFHKYVKGIESVNHSVSSGAGILTALSGTILHHMGVPIPKGMRDKWSGRLAGYYGAKALNKYGPKIIDTLTGKQPPPPPKASLAERAFHQVRKVVYNPNEMTNAQMREKRKQDRIDKIAKRKQADEARMARAEKQRKDDAAYVSKMRKLYDERDARRRAAARGGKATLTDILLRRLTGKPLRANSYVDEEARKAERARDAYTWRRALGLGSSSDTFRYRDGYGLIGSAMDHGSALANSFLGTAAGALAGRAFGAVRFAGRGAGHLAHIGFRALRTRGLRAAVNSVPRILPAAGHMIGSAGRFLTGPIGAPMAIGLIAHEADVGINQNFHGKTRRIADTAAKAAEYGSIGFLMGGPWGAAAGAAIGAVVANSDYVSSMLKGIGHALSFVAKPLWHSIEAVGRGAWDVTKFTGRAIHGLWTTVFGQSAKVDQYGHVKRQHKASLLEDMRIAMFGRDEKRTRTGEIEQTARRSVFGLVRDGFTKTFFGDKFSNGVYKPGTSLLDEVGDTLKKAATRTAAYIGSMPKRIETGLQDLWGWMKHTASAGLHGVTDAVSKAKHAVSRGWDKTKAGASRLARFGHNLIHHPRDTIRRQLRKSKLVRNIADHPMDAINKYVIGDWHDTAVPGVVGDFYAAGAWLFGSDKLKDPKTPQYKYVKACMTAYGLPDNGMYQFIHTLESTQEKVRKNTAKPFSQNDIAWMAGRFGLDPKNADCVNYFTMWFNNRFMLVSSMLMHVLDKYNLTVDNALSADDKTMTAILRDLDSTFGGLDASILALKPTLDAYRKFSKQGTAEPPTLQPTQVKPPNGFDPQNQGKGTGISDPSNSNGQASGGAIPGSGLISPASLGGAGDTSNGKMPPANWWGDGNDGYGHAAPDEAATRSPAMAKGSVTDQPEYKKAFALLMPNVQKLVATKKSLQFVLWATSVQHGTKDAAKIFNNEYHDGQTDQGYIKNIYMERSTRFTDKSSGDRIQALMQEGREQTLADNIDNGSATPDLAAMGQMIGHPISPAGNGTKSGWRPRGIRNNNPGNLEFEHQRGATPEPGSGRFAVFPTMAEGIRQLRRQLLIYDYRGNNTIYGIIRVFAPPPENDTAGYANTVARRLGVSPYQHLDIRNPAINRELVNEIIRVEQGPNQVSMDQINDALGYGPDGKVLQQGGMVAPDSGSSSDGSGVGSATAPAGGGSTPTSSSQSTTGTLAANTPVPVGTPMDSRSNGVVSPNSVVRVNASLDHAPITNAIGDLHATLRSMAAAQNTPAPTPAPSTSNTTTNHIGGPTIINAGNSQTGFIDMSLKKQSAVTGVSA